MSRWAPQIEAETFSSSASTKLLRLEEEDSQVAELHYLSEFILSFCETRCGNVRRVIVLMWHAAPGLCCEWLVGSRRRCCFIQALSLQIMTWREKNNNDNNNNDSNNNNDNNNKDNIHTVDLFSSFFCSGLNKK